MTKSGSDIEIELPVLKLDPNRLFDVIDCAYLHEYDREGFKDAVLKVFPGRDEKSVFRGIAIPTLRRLGLIIGFEDVIRLSSDGYLLANALHLSVDQGKRGLRALLLEYELRREWGIMLRLAKKPWSRHELISVFIDRVKAPNLQQAKERLVDWFQYLCFSSLLVYDERLRVNRKNLTKAKQDLNMRSKMSSFTELLLRSYREVRVTEKGTSTVDIEDVRRTAARIALEEKDQVLTSTQFDELLRTSVEMATTDRLISFGRSMGAEEKLFEFRGRYYQTINIRLSGEES